MLTRVALGAGLDEVIVVVDTIDRVNHLPEGVTVLLDEGGSQASALRSAVDWCTREGVETIILATLDPPLPGTDVVIDAATWRRLGASDLGPLVVATAIGRNTGLFRIEADVWPLLPLDGAIVATLSGKIGLLRELEVSEIVDRDQR